MASFKIVIERRAEKELRKLNPVARKRVADAIDALADNPEPPAARKMVGFDGYRLRVGDYRVLYRINGRVLEVYVVKIAHRRDVYKK